MIKRIVTTALIAGTAALAVAAPAMAAEPPHADPVASTLADGSEDFATLVPGQAGDDLTDFSGAFDAFTAGNAQQTVTNR
ncbi:hypothetical protein ACIA8F_35685 [Streptomyces sp. NPDC051563]|uniref:hypothetical protein n=1 Tax=Streptomyces sp. NPDC051563 TaxID=3365659 RepID=UPI0037962B5E